MAETIVEPIAGPPAFAAVGPAAEQSQAAILLGMGMQLRGDPESLHARAYGDPSRAMRADLAARVYRDGSPAAAAALFDASLRSPSRWCVSRPPRRTWSSAAIRCRSSASSRRA